MWSRQIKKVKQLTKGLIFVISGPSGSGKTTLLNRLLAQKNLKGNLVKTVSFTTRPKRRAETEGHDYHFITRESFFKELGQGAILEYTRYLDFYYGTAKKNLTAIIGAKKHDAAMCLDTTGALRIRRLFPKKSVLIFIAPPSSDVLKSRLKKRAREGDKEMLRRLELVQKEIALAKRFDYFIVNKTLSTALKKLKEIIIKERGKRQDVI